MYCYLVDAQLYCAVMCFNQVMLRTRKEMNVERGRERNTDSNEELRSVVCWFRLLQGSGKRRWKKPSMLRIL